MIEPPVKRFDDQRRVVTAIYGLTGAVCLVSLAQLDTRHLNDFLYYLLCAAVTALWMRTRNATTFPSALLVMLLASEDLNLPELLVVACLISLLGQFREMRRTLPRASAVIVSVASACIGIVAASAVHQAFAVVKYDTLFPAPVIASSLVLLLNWGLARTLEKSRAISLVEMLMKECRPLLPWFVGAAYWRIWFTAAPSSMG